LEFPPALENGKFTGIQILILLGDLMKKCEVLNGNELLVQGGLEAGFSLYTGYPGSPLADFFNVLDGMKNDLKSQGIRVVIANSEANAAAMASGAKMAGQNCLVAMKSMGLHVAADALSVGNFANPGTSLKNLETGELEKSGVVVVVGDDPWSISTSTPADSRYLFKHLHIPFLEPATPQELKDWMKVALQISRESSVYQGVLLTTFMAEGGGLVEISPSNNSKTIPKALDTTTFDLSENVMVPPNSFLADKKMIEIRFPKVLKTLNDLDLDQVWGSPSAKIGVISAGGVFETLKHFFEQENLLASCSLYKLASSYPLTSKKLLPFLKSLETLIVVEEKRGFLEDELMSFINQHRLSLTIWGKKFPQNQLGFPAFGGLSYEIIAKKLKEVLSQIDGKIASQISDPLVSKSFNIPARLPTFCPGCPHRETLSLMKELRQTLKEKNINLLSHGDVGCYSLAFLSPFKEMHDLSAMGQGGALATGSDLFATNPSIVLMGDSTFFHSGLTSISNSVQSAHNITYIILDNDNTAMTGHQMTPRTGVSVEGLIRPKQDILNVVKSLGVTSVIEVNPSDRHFYRHLLEKTVMSTGTKVIVSNKECALTMFARKKKQDQVAFANNETQTKIVYQINTDVCEDCRVCVEATGCPGLSQTFDAYGPKIFIDQQICVNDSYCTKIEACPSFEQITIKDYHPTLYQTFLKTSAAEINHRSLPLPNYKRTLNTVKEGTDFQVVVIGVGGSGVTTISRVLAAAAANQSQEFDLDFKFVDQKGLAQRNGSVISHLSFFKKGKSHAAINAEKSCQLILSPDLLEAARAIKYLANLGMVYCDKNFQIPLSVLLEDEKVSDPLTAADLWRELKQSLQNQIAAEEFKKISFDRYGKSVYSLMLLLGYVFQAGELPFSLEHMLQALRDSVPSYEWETNSQAFFAGRELYQSLLISHEGIPNQLVEKTISTQYQLFCDSLKDSCAVYENSQQLIKKFDQALKQWQSIDLEKTVDQNFQMQYLHDLLIYDRGEKLPEIFVHLKKLYLNYHHEVLKKAVRVLIKTYWIKDEVMVSHLMISPLKRTRDQMNFKKLGRNFKVKHINRPQFIVGPFTWEFNIHPPMILIKLMRHARFLRKILTLWHKKEKLINTNIREKILTEGIHKLSEKDVRKLDSVKGYRQVRYQSAEAIGKS
jgi:indolepyruvate ferredoxin oxidoreductase